MKSHKIPGKIDDKGSFKYSNIETLKEFFSQNKGSKVAVTFEIVNEDVTPKFLGWFYQVILPQVQQAFKESGDFITIDEVEQKIKELCPIMQELKFYDGKKSVIFKEFKDISNVELRHCIDFIIMAIAENLNYIINE